MKKISTLAILLLMASIWTGWKFTDRIDPVTDRTDAIACMQLETLEAYQLEATSLAFASLHPIPKTEDPGPRLGKMIRFKAADGKEASGYFIPSKKKSDKWLIVIQEWWGLNDNIKEEADKYAGDLRDMNVLAVDMYDGRVATTPDSAMKIMRSVDMARLSAIIKGAIDQAGKKASIYSVGWCFGGMWSLQTAIIAGSQAKGTVMFYGRPEKDREKIKAIQSEVIGFFGNKDQSPSVALVNEFEESMRVLGKQLTTHRYEAGHGFANPSNPNFDPAATADSYTKAIAFLKSH